MSENNAETGQYQKPSLDPKDFTWVAMVKLALFSLLLPLILFGSAGSLDWTMGWLYTAIVLGVTFGSRFIIMRINPDLITERVNSVARTDLPVWDRILLPFLIGLCPIALWLVAGLSKRFEFQPRIPFEFQVAAIPVIVAAGLFTSWAMVVNRFFSAVVRIQHDRGHTVVSSGPYRIVRHPGYAGGILVNLAAPLMLDACWAFIPGVIASIAMVIRTAAEDRTLQTELPGYKEYTRHTRHRLLPGIW